MDDLKQFWENVSFLLIEIKDFHAAKALKFQHKQTLIMGFSVRISLIQPT